MLKVECPNCTKTIKAQDDSVGKIGKCPGCGGRVEFPGAAADRAEAWSKTYHAEQQTAAPTAEGDAPK